MIFFFYHEILWKMLLLFGGIKYLVVSSFVVLAAIDAQCLGSLIYWGFQNNNILFFSSCTHDTEIPGPRIEPETWQGFELLQRQHWILNLLCLGTPQNNNILSFILHLLTLAVICCHNSYRKGRVSACFISFIYFDLSFPSFSILQWWAVCEVF